MNFTITVIQTNFLLMISKFSAIIAKTTFTLVQIVAERDAVTSITWETLAAWWISLKFRSTN